jgi:1-acyl-sn-glycerol-3-phosphate acyltransferase
LIPGESAIIIANHQSYTDSLVIAGIALRYGMLPYLKFFAKESLKWVPILGTLIRFQFLFCSLNDSSNK